MDEETIIYSLSESMLETTLKYSSYSYTGSTIEYIIDFEEDESSSRIMDWVDSLPPDVFEKDYSLPAHPENVGVVRTGKRKLEESEENSEKPAKKSKNYNYTNRGDNSWFRPLESSTPKKNAKLPRATGVLSRTVKF